MTDIAENQEKNGDFKASEENATAIPSATRKDIIISDYIRKSLEIVASAEGFRNYDFVFDHGSNVGDGFVGLILKVNIKEKNSDKSLSVLAKIPPQSKARREMPGTMVTFEREVYLYNVLLPEFVAFQKEKKIDKSQGFFNFPKVYYADLNTELKDAIIIMEDLRDSGHKMWDKYKPIDLEHAKLTMVALGRLHALSFAMKKRKPEAFEKFKETKDIFCNLLKDQTVNGMLQQTMSRSLEVLSPTDLKGRQRFLKISENMAKTLEYCVDVESSEPYAVLGHGDCWMNNYLYHYTKGIPDDIVLIDWQLSRYCTPAADISYFIFVCTDKKTRDKHFDELINLYHHSLKELLDHLGGDTTTQFPFTALLRQLRRFGRLGIISGCCAVPMLQTKPENMMDMDVIAEMMKNMDAKELEELTKQYREKNKDSIEKINSRVRDLIEDGMRYGYL